MNELNELEVMARETTDVAITNELKAALVRDLSPVAGRLVKYEAAARSITVANEAEAEEAAQICVAIAADITAVNNHDILQKIIEGLFKLHRRATAFRALFIGPMERDRKTIKSKVIAWQEGERKKAEEIQRKLQAEADAKAARERDALLKKAESVKSPEKQEAYREQAASVIAPTVHIEAPKGGLRTSKAWKVKNIDQDGFFKALANRPDLRGYVEIKTTNMERSKAANPSMEIPGCVFEQITR